MPHAPPCPSLACLEPHALVSPWQAARPPRKGTRLADDCVAPQAGLLLGGGGCAQAVVRGQRGGGPFSPRPAPPSPPSSPPLSWPQASIPAPRQAQRQLLHAELKLVLQQKGERKRAPGAHATPSSAMEARSRSAEVSAHILPGETGGARLRGSY